MKKRLAIWLHGGIGTGHFAQGVPMLEKLLNGLAETSDLVIYSHCAPNKEFRSSRFVFKTAPRSVTSGILRWLYLIAYFLIDNFKNRFQVIFSFWGYPSGIIVVVLGKLLNRPSVIFLLGADAAGIPSIDYGILHKKCKKEIAFWTYRRASCLLCISKFQVDQLKKYGFYHSINVIPWGADLSLHRFKQRSGHSLLNIIHVGYYTPVKDQMTLLMAFAMIIRECPAKLKILGIDRCDDIQKKCIELGIDQHVELAGIIPYNQMPIHYDWADIMLHTSMSEGQCGALTEAAASGVLMAGTNVGLLYDLSEDYGIKVAVGDFKDLAMKVISIVHDEQAWNEKISNARMWSEKHDLFWTINELNAAIHAL